MVVAFLPIFSDARKWVSGLPNNHRILNPSTIISHQLPYLLNQPGRRRMDNDNESSSTVCLGGWSISALRRNRVVFNPSFPDLRGPSDLPTFMDQIQAHQRQGTESLHFATLCLVCLWCFNETRLCIIANCRWISNSIYFNIDNR